MNKTCDELRDRLAKALGDSFQRVHVTTICAFCLTNVVGLWHHMLPNAKPRGHKDSLGGNNLEDFQKAER